ncbi:phosphotransferase [Clostridium perfringens]|nr:phosphotransferase [Clostridium perfringens]
MNKDSKLFKELSNSELSILIDDYFGNNTKFEGSLITGGLFNTTYCIKLLNTNEKFILRVGPVNTDLLLPFELNLMKGEEYVYSLCEANNISSSKILKCDVSKKLIPRDYMIIEYIDSKPFSELKFDKETESFLYTEVGKHISKLHQITSKKFGRVYDVFNNKGFNSWSEFIFDEFQKVKNRLNEFDIFTEEELHSFESIIKRNFNLLDEIKTPHLVHCDLWTGNILIESYNSTPKVAAIIDADRSLFGDTDFELANPWIINEDFLNGYGMTSDDSHNKIIRKNIYRLINHLIEAYVWKVEYNNPIASENEKLNAIKLLNDIVK